MKYSISLILAAMAIVLAIGCDNDKAEGESTFISGEIMNPAKKYVLLDTPDDERDTIRLEGNQFMQKYDKLSPGYYRLITGNRSTGFYLEQGDSIYLKFDETDEEADIVISGRGAERNRYLQQRAADEMAVSKVMRALYKKDEDVFLKAMDSLEGARLESLDKVGSTAAGERFYELEKARIKFDIGLKTLRYPEYHRYLAQDTAYQPSKEFMESFNDITVNDTAWLAIPEFERYAMELLQKNAMEEYQGMSKQEQDATDLVALEFEEVDEVADKKAVREFLMYHILQKQLKYYGPGEVVDSLIDKFRERCQRGKYISRIGEMRENWRRIEPGNKAPGFRYPDMEGEEHALEDFRGKYVYIDVWASWCGPCRRQIPHLEELINDYSGKNIVFMSVSVDENKQAWEDMVQEKDMKGYQLYAGGWEAKIARKFMINSIPRFILIDPAGKIVDSNAPRPSSDEIRQLFKEKGI